MLVSSNGIGHRADEGEFDVAAPQMLPAAEAGEQRELIQEPVSAADDGTEQMIIPDETTKPLEDAGADAAEQEPATDECQDPMTSEQERPSEVEEVEQEVEGKLLL